MKRSSVLLASFLLCLSSLPAMASDLTLFGGGQRAGKLTFQSASTGVESFNPKTFGVFGLRIGQGKVVGAEHTLAYAPNLIQTGTSALIIHENLLIQIPTPVVKPYVTAGLGLIHSGGLSLFGNKFAVNYGAGLKVMAGPVGLGVDIRGYRAPKISLAGFTGQQRLDFVQFSAGIVFRL